MTYSERLHIPWWWTLIALIFVGSLDVAVFAYVDLPVGITFAVVTLIAAICAIVLYGGSRLQVDERGLRVGRYRLGAAYIAGATPLEGEDARSVLGPQADHRAFLYTRPYVPGLVRVDLDDPADPHSAWLISTRDPQSLATAIDKVKA